MWLDKIKRHFQRLIYKGTLGLLLMSAFHEAWVLLKSRQNGNSLTLKERQFVNLQIVKMMNSGDIGLQEEAEILYTELLGMD